MLGPAPAGVAFRFGAFELDLAAGELRKHGIKIKLQEQPFQILAMLLERAGEVVTREDLRERLWPADTFVDFDNGLNAATSLPLFLSALKKSPDPLFQPSLIWTAPNLAGASRSVAGALPDA